MTPGERRRELARHVELGGPDVACYELDDGLLELTVEYRPSGGLWGEVARTCSLDPRPSRQRIRSAAQHLGVPRWRVHEALADARAAARRSGPSPATARTAS